MDKLILVVDLLLDETDLLRVQNSRPGYLYTPQSNALYMKHINHLDYHRPYLVISYGRDNHEIINLETNRRKQFLINHQGLDEYFSTAVGVTEDLAMIAIGDINHTLLQVVEVGQPLKVHLFTTYREDNRHLPLPRYFTGNPKEAILVYSDGSELRVNLSDFTCGQRVEAEIDQLIRPRTVLSDDLSIVGPFILLSITPQMSKQKLLSYSPLINCAAQSHWIAVKEEMMVHRELASSDDFGELFDRQSRQMQQILAIIE